MAKEPRSIRIRKWFGRRWLTGPGWTGAASGALLLSLLVWGWRVAERVIPTALGTSLLLSAADLLVVAGVAVLVLLLGTGLALLFKRRLPVPFLAVFAASAVLVGSMAPGPSVAWWAWITVITTVAGSVFGASAIRRPVGPVRGVGVAVVALATLATCVVLVWPGAGPEEAVDKHTRTGTGMDWAGDPGPHAVTSFTYGSDNGGYGDVDVRSGSIDASEQLPEWDPTSLRTRGMGFDASELPLNATVWAPDTTPPEEGFPLVLIAHGNSVKPDNELGFGYLGEHLASHGYVVASVDQTYLNTGVIDTVGTLEQANQMRARVLMEHLALWGTWDPSEEPRVPRVDLSRTTLAGHSRGGEAAAVVAALHHGTATSSVRWPVPELPDVDITAVVALAPTAGVVLPVSDLEGVDYLTVAGTHDADLSTFAGVRQHVRTDPGPGGLSTAVLLERANHTQFNSDWGRFDTGAGLSTRMLNTAVLIDPEEQRTATRGLVTAFLHDSVHGDPAARVLFTDALDQASWLPSADIRSAVNTGEPNPTVDFNGTNMETGELPKRTGDTDIEVFHVRGDGADGSVEFRLEGPSSFELADAAPVGHRTEPMEVHVNGCDLGEVGPTFDGTYGKIPALMPFGPGEPFLSTFTVPADCVDDTVEVAVSGVGEHGLYLSGVEAE